MKRSSGRFLFIVSHFTVLIMAMLVFWGIAWRVRVHVAEEMADKQNLVMKQAMKATDGEIEKVIRKAIDISGNEYVQWFRYIEEPLGPRELFYTTKLVKSLQEFYEGNRLIIDYYVYYGRSGRVADANGFYPKQDYYGLVWSYEGMTEQEWEAVVLHGDTGGVFIGERVMCRDSARKELLTYIYRLENNNAGGTTKVILLLDKGYIADYLKAGVVRGAVAVTDASGNPLLNCRTDGIMTGDLPVYSGDGWEIIKFDGKKMLVTGIRSEKTGWVYTSCVPMDYVMENALWVNRLIITGILLLLVLGSPLCFYWARRSYLPIRRLVRILFESGYREKQNESDMDYLEHSLCRMMEKHKDLETVYQEALKNYNDLEADVKRNGTVRLWGQNAFCFSAEQKRKLVNYIWTDGRMGCEEILNDIYEENHCLNLPAKSLHQLYFYVTDMVLVALDDSGIDINRIFEGQQKLFDDLLAAESREQVISAALRIMEHIGDMLNENKLDTKELVARRAIEYMKKHYREREFSLSLMADELRVSPEHLSRVIKSVTGTNYVETLNQMRLEQAKIYLKTTDMKLEEIAERAGWGSARYFIRIFKQYEGITPGKYRGSGTPDAE